MKGFGMAPIVREGGIADPDRFTWKCNLETCETCRARYQNWKKLFDEEQSVYVDGAIRMTEAKLKEKNNG